MFSSGLALFIAYLAMGSFEFFSSKEVVIRELIGIANIIGANSVAAIEFNDPKIGEETLKALDVDSKIVAAEIIRNNGTSLVSYQKGTDSHDFVLERFGDTEAYFTKNICFVSCVLRPFIGEGCFFCSSPFSSSYSQ
jgi:hypothetical protein